MSVHEKYIQYCLQLAQLGAGRVAPNPMVGAILVYEDRIIGEGYHRLYGQAHAEVNCVNSVAEADRPLISQSTMYVSLEPCAHFGKTPPCSRLIISEKIPRVVIGCADPFAEVNGRGIQQLKDAGVEVTVGVCEKEAIELNKRFFTFHQQQRPYIILKWAQSADGLITGNGEKRVLISGDTSNRLVHRWRSEEAAIMVGARTAILDDPALTTRLWPGSNPLRIVLDMNNRMPSHLQLLNGQVRTLIFNGDRESEEGLNHWHKLNATLPVLPQVLTALYEQQVQSVMVEGGATLLQSFIDAGLWDEARVIVNPGLEIGQGLAAPQLADAQPESRIESGNDHIYIYRHN